MTASEETHSIQSMLNTLNSEREMEAASVASESVLKPMILDATLRTQCISASAFSDANFGDNRGEIVFSPFDCVLTSNGGLAYAHAAVELPDTADIQTVRLYFVNDDPAGSVGFLMYRIDKGNAIQQQQRHKVMAGVETMARSSSLQFLDDSSVVRSVIDNAKYAYSLVVYLPSKKSRIYAADVFYRKTVN